MNNHAERIGALRRYLEILRREVSRLSWLGHSPNASDGERLDARHHLPVIAQKIIAAERELSDLERRRPK
jgi:hypothetical protein